MPELPSPHQIDFQPTGLRVETEPGETILAAAQRSGIQLLAVCGGNGRCADCKVRLMKGELSPLTEVETFTLTKAELADGTRLACQASPLTDVKVFLPPESLSTAQRLQIESSAAAVELDLSYVWHDLSLKPADTHDPHSDADRLREAWLAAAGSDLIMDRAAISHLPEELTRCGWKTRLVAENDHLSGILKAGQQPLGLAVDIGSTKLAEYLVRLADGEILASGGSMNPQIAYGEDVVARIARAVISAGNEAELRARLVDALNELARQLTDEAGVESSQVCAVVLVGNTVMSHFAAGLPVQSLGTAPFSPVETRSMEFYAYEIGLRVNPLARVYLPPNISGYVGSDHVAMLLASGCHPPAQKVLALDIGTNTEISISANGKLYSCSCASGPAFEGARIQAGMRAIPGAVERVSLSEDVVRVYTIDQMPAVGICGSGILDAIAVMLADGAIDSRGVLKRAHERVDPTDFGRAYRLVPDVYTASGKNIYVNRKDVNEIQLAKAAIRAGCEVLLAEAGLKAEQLDQFIVAGAFGTYLSLESAIRIGMFPDIPREKFHQIGNAAGAGARELLVSASARVMAEDLARQAHYVELTTHPDFSRLYVDQMHFPVE